MGAYQKVIKKTLGKSLSAFSENMFLAKIYKGKQDKQHEIKGEMGTIGELPSG